MCVPELKSAQRLDFTTFQEVSLAKPPIDSARHQVSAKNFVGFKQTLFKVDWLLDEEMEILEDGAITVEAEVSDEAATGLLRWCRGFSFPGAGTTYKNFQAPSPKPWSEFFPVAAIPDSPILPFKVELIEDSKYREPEATQAIENYESLINDREWADYCLSCSDDKKIYVQKSIIASHCPELAELIRGRPMISEFRDIDSETMLELVRFIYCRKVNNIGTIAAKLLVVAHKYNVDNLKEICVSSLMESISVGNVFGILDIADRLKEGRLMENCIDFIKW